MQEWCDVTDEQAFGLFVAFTSKSGCRNPSREAGVCPGPWILSVRRVRLGLATPWFIRKRLSSPKDNDPQRTWIWVWYLVGLSGLRRILRSRHQIKNAALLSLLSSFVPSLRPSAIRYFVLRTISKCTKELYLNGTMMTRSLMEFLLNIYGRGLLRRR